MSLLKIFANKLGIDKAIGYTALGRILQGAGGVISVLLVSTFLTGVEQGFYYTFASILAVQVFFELGLTGIITQYVAHEKAPLSEVDNQISGDATHCSRLSYLLHFCLKWYGLLAIVLVVGLCIAGFLFFTCFYHSQEVVHWQIPWFLLVIGTSLNFVIAPISAFVEGLGKVKDIAKIRLFQQLISQVVLWIALLSGLKLYAAVFTPFIGVAIFVMMTWKLFGRLLVNLYKIKITEKVGYLKEIFPYQWRIALSWISGYFIFQLFNPVIFAFDGAVAAGQMGMTLTIINSIHALALSWIMTKVPIMSSLIALKQYKQLDTLFNKTIGQQLFIAFLGIVMFFGGVFVLRYFHITLKGVEIGDRLLPYFPMLMMSIAMLVNQYIGSIATYLRCHKKEPFLINSIVGGVLCTISTVFLGKNFGVYGVTIGYCAITLSLLPWGYYIYTSNKKKWHNRS